MITETGSMSTEIVYSDDRKNRYLLRKTWGEGEKAMLLMTNAGTADTVSLDYTTLYAIRNLNQLGFTSVDMVNLTSEITTKINIPKDGDFPEDKDNIAQIMSSAEQASKIIVAVGKLPDSNKKVKTLHDKILEHLRPHADKLFQICDDHGDYQFHPLAPSVRFTWHLIKFELNEKQEDSPPPKKTRNSRKKQSQDTDPTAQKTDTTETKQPPEQEGA